MNNYFTTLRRLFLCLFLGCFATWNVEATVFNKYKFSKELIETLSANHVSNNTEFYLEFNTKPDFPFMESHEYWSYSNRQTYFSDPGLYYWTHENLDIDTSQSDSVTLYYCVYGKNFFIHNASMRISCKDIEEGMVTINPLKGIQKISAKCPLGVDGQPIASEIQLLYPGKFCHYTDFSLGGGLDILVEPNSDRDEVNLWMYSDKPVDYVIFPKKQEYFMQTYQLNPDTISNKTVVTGDYRNAKKVTIRMKDTQGKYAYLNHTAICQEIQDSSFNESKIRGNFFTKFVRRRSDSTAVTSVDAYALPGKHFVYLNNEAIESPRPLFGLFEINDKDDEQYIEFDLSNYLTFRIKGNPDLGISVSPFMYSNSNTGTSLNVRENHFKSIRFHQARYTTSKVVNGQREMYFWPAIGYEKLDSLYIGTGNKYVCIRDIKLPSKQVYDLDFSDLGVIKLYMSKVFYEELDLLQIVGNDTTTVHGSFPRDMWTEKDLNKIVEISLDRPKGEYTFAFYHSKWNHIYPDLSNVFQKTIQLNLPEETKEVYFNDYNILKIKSQANDKFNTRYISLVTDQTEEYIDGFDFNIIDGSVDSCYQKIFLFQQKGLAAYNVKYDPYTLHSKWGTVEIKDKMQEVVVDPESFHKVRLQYTRAWFEDKEYWKDETDSIDNQRYFYSYSEGSVQNPFRFAIRFGIGKRGSGRLGSCVSNYPYYIFQFDGDTSKVLETPQASTQKVSFFDGETPLLEKTREGEKIGVKIFVLNWNNLGEEDELKIILKKFGSRSNEVEFLTGVYRVENEAGKSIYFEIEPNGGKKVIDFANPPEPPVGIGEVINEGHVPAVYYDMSGRQLDCAQKGVNIVRMKNGKVKKVMVK